MACCYEIMFYSSSLLSHFYFITVLCISQSSHFQNMFLFYNTILPKIVLINTFFNYQGWSLWLSHNDLEVQHLASYLQKNGISYFDFRFLVLVYCFSGIMKAVSVSFGFRHIQQMYHKLFFSRRGGFVLAAWI